MIRGWNVGTDAFIVVKFDRLPGTPATIASAVEGQPTSSVSVTLEKAVGTGLRVVNLADPEMEAAIRAALDRRPDPTNRLDGVELAAIHYLNLSEQYLQQATNLVLRFNSPLAAQPNRWRLEAGENQLDGLPSLALLTNLTIFGLGNNALFDISPRLRVLDLGNNRIRDLAPLANLTAPGMPCMWRDSRAR